MKICTTEIPDEVDQYENAIESLALHVSKTEPDLLILAEMPFTPWIFYVDNFSEETWCNTVRNHDELLARLGEMIPTPLITSRPITVDGLNLNQAIYLDRNRETHPLRAKRYLPNDFPAVERVWFSEGEQSDPVFDIQGCKIGLQLCSEIMYTEIPRKLAMSDVQILVQPRATGGHPRWRAASVLAASTSGAFVVGANRRSSEKDWFAGSSWIYSPEGDLLAETTKTDPFVTIEIDLVESNNAKSEYPITMFRHYE